MRLPFAIGLALVASVCTVSIRSQTADASLTTRILAGDIDAIFAAAKSGDSAYIPALRQVLARSPRKPSREYIGAAWFARTGDVAGAARFALGMLDDGDALQALWCDARSEQPISSDIKILDLGGVGGWFAIRALVHFVTPGGEIHYERARRAYGETQRYPNDVQAIPLEYELLEELHRLVPSAPLSVPRTFEFDAINRRRSEWGPWVTAHADELSKLKPIGQDVDFSDEACNTDGTVRKK